MPGFSSRFALSCDAFLGSIFALFFNLCSLFTASRHSRYCARHHFNLVFKMLQSLDDFRALIFEDAGEHLPDETAKRTVL
jgi:hypothetical protein